MLKALSRTALAAVSLLFAAASASSQPAPKSIAMTIDASRRGVTIDRNIFGQFAEHLGTGIYGGVWVGPESKIPNVRGIRTDVVNALRAIGVPNVRWPGGCFADEYHWRDGIGPAARRKVTINSNWGGSVEPNSFGTHEFMDFAEQIGAEAYISVNVGSGTVKEAADWIEYMTASPETTAGRERAANGRTLPWKIKFLGLGNESWACGGAMTPAFYTDQMKLYSRFIRNYNPEQKEPGAMARIAVGPGDEKTQNYTEAVMKAWTTHDYSWDIQGMSLHNYTTGGWPPSFSSTAFGEQEYATLVKESYKMEPLIANTAAVMDRYDPEKKLTLAVDEWGVWLAKLPGSREGFLQQQNTLRDALIAAVHVNIFSRHADRVRMANIAQMVNVLQSMILTDGPKMLLTPTYHVFKMYKPFQDATLIPVSYDAGVYKFSGIELPRVDAIAAKDKAGKIWLAAVNLDPRQPVTIEARLAGSVARAASGLVLTAPAVDSLNSFDQPDIVTPRALTARAVGGKLPVTLPPASLIVVEID